MTIKIQMQILRLYLSSVSLIQEIHKLYVQKNFRTSVCRQERSAIIISIQLIMISVVAKPQLAQNFAIQEMYAKKILMMNSPAEIVKLETVLLMHLAVRAQQSNVAVEIQLLR